MDALQTVYHDISPMVPGDRLMFNVRVVNLSSHKYAYESKSFVLTDTNLSGITDANYGVTTAAIDGLESYTGKPLATYATVYRNRNAALAALGCKKAASLSDEALDTVLKATKKLSGQGNYAGIEDLAQYYIDFYNKKYSTSHTRLDEFTNSQLSSIFNGYFPTDAAAVADLVPETNKEISETGYDFFYNACMSFGTTSYSQYSELNKTNAASASAAGATKTYPSYTADGELDSAFSSFSAIAAGETASSKFIYQTVDFYLTGNSFQLMILGFQMGFTLRQVDTSYTVVANYYTSRDGGAYTQDGSVTEQDAAAAEVGQSLSADEKDEWASYSGSDYTLDRTRSTLTGTAVLDPAQNVLTLNYYRSVISPTASSSSSSSSSSSNPGGGSVVVSSETPSSSSETSSGTPDTVISEPETPLASLPSETPASSATEIPDDSTPKAEVPQTGDTNAVLFGCIAAALSAAGLMIVFFSSRRRRGEK